MGVEDAPLESYGSMEMLSVFRMVREEVEEEQRRVASGAIQRRLAGLGPSSLCWQERISILNSSVRACQTALLYTVCTRPSTL